MANKVGRNDPCSCGSGKKYKKCCMNIVKHEILHTLVKTSDLGSADPFIARMYMQIFEIRDLIFPTDKDRREFDEYYTPVLQNLMEARLVKDRCVELVNKHRQDLKSGKVTRVENKTLTVMESIDDNLNIWFKDFFIRGYIANQNIIRLAKFIGFKISFIFKNDQDFDEESKKFLKNNPNGGMKFLVDMVSKDRKEWFSQFVEIRTKIEHSGFQVPCLQYRINEKSEPIALEPTFGEMDIESYIDLMWNNLFPFCEDVIVFLLSSKLPEEFAVKHIPVSAREKSKPIRYVVVPKSDIPPE
ncbi:MAG: SEC-C metal-binding domain-containing protein, partial [Candidatus Berkelbacteria bacterium]|nr:SEC-C metal-binding domain-containing protein [Candidatus Berkelbacteria bacterium]